MTPKDKYSGLASVADLTSRVALAAQRARAKVRLRKRRASVGANDSDDSGGNTGAKVTTTEHDDESYDDGVEEESEDEDDYIRNHRSTGKPGPVGSTSSGIHDSMPATARNSSTKGDLGSASSPMI